MAVEPFTNNRWFVVIVYAIMALLLFYMLMQVYPLLQGVVHFLCDVLTPFFIAMIISYVLNPIVSLLNKRHVPRMIAVLIIYAVFIVSLVVILMNIIPIMVKQVNELNQHIPDLTMKAQNLMHSINDARFVPESVQKGINNALIKFEGLISQTVSDYINGIGSTINALFLAFIIPFLAFYILKDYKLMEKSFIKFTPQKYREKLIKLMTDIDLALGSYVRGQVIVCVIIGLMAYVGFWLIGLKKYALLLAVVVAFTNVIPYLGPYLGAVPALIVASTISWKMMIYVFIVNTVVQTLESNFISPQVVGRTLKMHPLTVILALLVGGEAAGIIGLILAVPFFAVLKVIVQHLLQHYRTLSRK